MSLTDLPAPATARPRRIVPIVLTACVILGLVAGLIAADIALPQHLLGGPPSPTPGAGQASPGPDGDAPAGGGAPGQAVDTTSGGGVVACPAAKGSKLPGRPARPNLALAVPVLMYHRIVPTAEAGNSLPPLVVAPQVFEAQMAALAAAHWHTITLAELAVDLQKGIRPPARTFVVTFDDGYDDGFTYALPILRRFGFVGTYFIVSGRLGEPSILTDEHVKALAAAGMEIADHTVSHADLTALATTALRFQVGAAARTIASLVGHGPTTLAYPFGDEDARVISEVAACGFAMAVTNVEGVRETWPGRFLVPRLRVGPGMSAAAVLALVSHPRPPAPHATAVPEPQPFATPAPRPTVPRGPIRTPKPTPRPTARPTPSPPPAETPTPAPPTVAPTTGDTPAPTASPSPPM